MDFLAPNSLAFIPKFIFGVAYGYVDHKYRKGERSPLERIGLGASAEVLLFDLPPVVTNGEPYLIDDPGSIAGMALGHKIGDIVESYVRERYRPTIVENPALKK